MDIDKIFNQEQPVPELSPDRLEAMMDTALAYPQLKKPANQNMPFIRKALATAAVVMLMIAAGIELYPTSYNSPAATASEDAYGEVTDLMLYETLNSLS